MQLPTTQTPTAKCLELSHFTTRMLSKFPENAVLATLAPKLSVAAKVLADAEWAVDEASSALVAIRVDVKHADYQADIAVRRLLRVAQMADGKTAGRITSQLFPEGVTPIIKPVGASQLSEMRDLEGRLDAIGGSWSEAAAEKEKILRLRNEYEAALEARKVGTQKVADLAAARDAAREDFLDIYAEVSGRVRAEFPRDSTQQDLFFTTVRGNGGGAPKEEGPEEPPQDAPKA